MDAREDLSLELILISKLDTEEAEYDLSNTGTWSLIDDAVYDAAIDDC